MTASFSDCRELSPQQSSPYSKPVYLHLKPACSVPSIPRLWRQFSQIMIQPAIMKRHPGIDRIFLLFQIGRKRRQAASVNRLFLLSPVRRRSQGMMRKGPAMAAPDPAPSPNLCIFYNISMRFSAAAGRADCRKAVLLQQFFFYVVCHIMPHILFLLLADRRPTLRSPALPIHRFRHHCPMLQGQILHPCIP